MAGFTDTVVEPNDVFSRATTKTFNREADTSGSQLVTNLVNVASSGITFAAEISADSASLEATTSIEREVTESITNSDYFTQARKDLNLAASIPNSTVRELKLQSLRNSLTTKFGGKRNQAAIDKAFKDTRGYVSPSQMMSTQADALELESQAAFISEVKTARASGLVGTDNEVLNASRSMAIGGATLSNANSAAGSAGGSSTGSFNANLLPQFDAAKDGAVKFASGNILPLMQEFSNADITRKAEIRAELGNLMFNQKALYLRAFGNEGINLSDKELDYIVSPSTTLFDQMGEFLGLKQNELTEEKSLELLNTNMDTALGIVKNSLIGSFVNTEAGRELMIAKEVGGDAFAATLMQGIDTMVPKIKKIAGDYGKDTSQTVAATLGRLVSGKVPFTDVGQVMVDQQTALETMSDVDPALIEDKSILSNMTSMIVDGVLQDKTVANQERIVTVMSGSNGVTTVRELMKVDQSGAEQAVNFFNETTNRQLTQRMAKVANKAEREGISVLFSDGKFHVNGESPALVEMVASLNSDLTMTTKYKEFGPDKKMTDIPYRNLIVGDRWTNTVQMMAETDGGVIDINVSPLAWENSDAFLKIGKPWYMRSEDEQAAQKDLRASRSVNGVQAVVDWFANDGSGAIAFQGNKGPTDK